MHRFLPLLMAVVFALGVASAQVLPKPQTMSAEGKPAPDFNLKDQSGRTFRLSSLLGQRVLLVFYRGSW